jgi:hypothetical protein
VRAKTFYADKLGVDVASVDIPVVGGHAGITILPLFSQATPGHSLKAEDINALTKRTQDGGTEVVLAKAGKVGPRDHCLCPVSARVPRTCCVHQTVFVCVCQRERACAC